MLRWSVTIATRTGCSRASSQAIQAHFRFVTHLRPFLYPEGPDTTVAFTLQRSSIQSRADAEDYVAQPRDPAGLLRRTP